MSDSTDRTPPLSGETHLDAESLVPDCLVRNRDQGRTDWLATLRAHQHYCWRLRQRVPAEVYLQRLPELRADEELALDLICSEVLLRIDLGETPSLDEYLRRFPQYETPLRDHFNLRDALAADPHLTRTYDAPLPPAAQDGERVAAAQPAVARPLIVPGYEILGELGRGGMGIVYKARQIRPRRLVALKTMAEEEPVSAARLTRFHAEAEMVARLRHPNIVQLYEVGEHAGRAYLSLEYLEGGSLTEKLAGQPLAAHEAVELVLALAGALHHVHLQGIIHRDLKPANVLLTAEGAPKLIDFGLARYRDHLAESLPLGRILGTPSYMAPEQANGWSAQIGPHTDVFGLGVVLYEVLTGVAPYRGRDPVAVWKQARRGEVMAPRRLNRRVPRLLERICLRALALEPAQRYASALDLEHALRRYLWRSRWTSAGWRLGLGLTGLVLAEALALAVWRR